MRIKKKYKGGQMQEEYSIQAKEIIKIVNRYYEIDCTENTRKRQIAEIRQIAMYLIEQNTNLSLHNIGKLFGKTHATVIHSINCVENFFEVNTKYNKTRQVEIRELQPKIERTKKLISDKLQSLFLISDISEHLQTMKFEELKKLKNQLLTPKEELEECIS